MLGNSMLILSRVLANLNSDGLLYPANPSTRVQTPPGTATLNVCWLSNATRKCVSNHFSFSIFSQMSYYSTYANNILLAEVRILGYRMQGSHEVSRSLGRPLSQMTQQR